MSWAALAITAGFLVAFLVQLGVFEDEDTGVAERGNKAPRNDRVVVSSSSITGFDREKQPFRLDSGSASQDPDKPHVVHLKQVRGSLRKKGGAEFQMTANGAVYDTKARTLLLKGDVMLVSEGEFVAKMPEASITLTDKRLYTEAPVEVRFKAGVIMSNGLEVTEDGRNVLFFNRIKAVMRGSKGKEDGK